MIEFEKPKFIKQLMGIARYFKYALDEYDLEIYWQSLNKYDFEEVTAAIYNHVQNPAKGNFMPRVADIVREIKAKEEPAEYRAMRAWAEVEQKIRSIGIYESPDFDDPLISHVICDMGGWIEICKVLEKDLVWMGKNFERRFISYVEYPPSQLTQKRLTGLFAKHNEKLEDASAIKTLLKASNDAF